MPVRENGEQRCSESVQQKCSKLLSNIGESELGPTIAALSFSEGNRGLPKLATLCHPSDRFSHGRGPALRNSAGTQLDGHCRSADPEKRFDDSRRLIFWIEIGRWNL
jgi:hypothetical protein